MLCLISTGAAKLSPPDRARVRDAVARHRELLAVTVALDPGAAAKLQQHYAQVSRGQQSELLMLARSWKGAWHTVICCARGFNACRRSMRCIAGSSAARGC